jgi:hypothetical protein
MLRAGYANVTEAERAKIRTAEVRRVRDELADEIEKV